MVASRLMSGLCLAALVAASPALSDEGEDWVRLKVGAIVRAEINWTQLRASAMTQFRASNPGERGVTQAGIDTLRQIQAAQIRASTATQVLVHDLDGDGRVTRDELVAAFGPRARQSIQVNGVQLEPTAEQTRQQLDKLVSDALAPDLDNDGVISAGEIRAHAEKRASASLAGWRASQYVPLTLDTDRDGAVSVAEFEAAVRREFDEVDMDRDGVISGAEAKSYAERLGSLRQAVAARERERAQAAQMVAMARSCQVAPPPADAKIVVLGAYEGQALSNVSIGGDDRETTVGNIEVSAGKEPLFLVAASYGAMVWRVWGATERVVGMLAVSQAADKASGGPRVGVVGLPRERVQFGGKAGCLPSFTDKEAAGAGAAAEALFGRRAETVSGIYGLQSVKVPSGQHIAANPETAKTIRPPEAGPGSALWKEMLRFNPAGLANIDPAEVVSALPARRYAVLPQQAGIAQLLEEGTLTVAGTSRGFHINGENLTPFNSPSAFLITRKMTFPAGLNGAHSVRFILARGVPMPDGDPGHSCVIDEATGKPVGTRTSC